MYSDWGKAARADISDIIEQLPKDASLDMRRRALRRGASDFHCGTSWGKKVWSRECRKYLEQHGLDPLPGRKVEDTRQPRLKAALDRGDITFPFRGQP